MHCTRAKNRPRFERYLHNNIICIKLGTAQQTFQTGDSTAEDKYNNFNPIFFSFFFHYMFDSYWYVTSTQCVDIEFSIQALYNVLTTFPMF